MAAIAAFDFFEIGDYLNDWLELLPTDPLSEKFETIGLESMYFLNNLGTFAVVLLLKALLVLLQIALYPV